MGLFLRLEDDHVSWSGVQDQTSLMQANLSSLEVAYGKSCAPGFVSMISVAFRAGTKIHHHGSKGMAW